MCELIEQTAIQASADYDIYQPLLLNVTTGISYEQLKACGLLHESDDDKRNGKGSKKFYDVRRKFFWLLDYNFYWNIMKFNYSRS
jgi:hypothetical protein